MTKDPWHFPRADLAGKTLTLLMGGPATALTLFAPRRTGKTEFLLKDLGPLAEAKGHRVLYASFWQAQLAPLAVLLHALETSHREGSLGDRVREAARALTPKLKLSAPLPDGGSAEAEIDLTKLAGPPPANLLLYLDDLIGRLAGTAKKPTLLLLDEVQELAREEANAPLVAALRTSLDRRADTVKTVFTGSSQEGLKAMFGAREAPFFHFATALDLPRLGAPFVDHLLATFARTAKRNLDRAAALDAFERLHGNPFYFRKLLEDLLLTEGRTVPDALAIVRGRIATELGYPETWLKLTELQRAVALELARGVAKPFGVDTRTAVAATLRRSAPPSASQIQAALRRLENLGIADTFTGKWAIEDPEFAAWISDQGEEAV